MALPWSTRAALGTTRRRLTSILDDGTVLVCAIFLVPGVMGLWVKKTEMGLSSGYLATARFLGYSREADLAWWQKLSFFRMDLAVMIVAIPIVMALLLRFVPRVPRATAAGVLGTILCSWYFFELQALGSIGRYLTPELIRDAVSWAVDFPESIEEYISIRGTLKLVAAVSVIACLSGMVIVRAGGGRPGLLAWLAEAGTLATLICGLLLSLVAHLMPVSTLVSHRSMLQVAGEAIWPGNSSFAIASDASNEELMTLYRRAAAVPVAPPVRGFPGSDKGHDLLVFIMETAPSRSYDPIRDRNSLPGIDMLLDRSFVARNHITTYPYTSDAIFSILTSMYPIGRRSFLRDDRPLSGAGLFPPLEALGYTGMVYLPYPGSFEEDTKMYTIAGASRIFIADDQDVARRSRAAERAKRTISLLPESSPAKVHRGDLLADRLTHDYMALDALREDIIEYKRAGRRFAALFVPQISHGPWFDLYGRESVIERGRDVMMLQDQWLAEIVALLEDNNWLDETIIVMTADHGIRTRVEDPSLEAGTISAYSFEVPLVVFAPGTLERMQVVDERTSHIDVAPTLHALLGVRPGDDFVTQGVPIMESEQLAERRVFMFASGYLGADGYAYRDEYVVRAVLNGFVHRNDALRIGPGTMVVEKDQAAGLVEPIELMYTLQPRLLESLRRH